MSNPQMVRVPIEVDVTYVNHAWYSSVQKRKVPQKKQYVIGIFQRSKSNNARIFTMPDNKPETIEKIILESIEKGAILFSEKNIIPESLDDIYEIYELPEGKHADGDLHLSNVKNMWKDLKRVIKSTHVHVSEKHLRLYCGEVMFRINNRNLSHWERFEMVLSGVKDGNKTCTWKQLTK